jgi:hypothetical protein
VRHIEEATFHALANQVTDGSEKCRERLARAGRSRVQRVLSRLDEWPGLYLRGRWLRKMVSNHAATVGWKRFEEDITY